METTQNNKQSWEYNLPLFKKFNFDVINLGIMRILIAVYLLFFVWWFFVCTVGIIDAFNSLFFTSTTIFKILIFFVLGIGGGYLIYWGAVKLILWIKEGYKKNE